MATLYVTEVGSQVHQLTAVVLHLREYPFLVVDRHYGSAKLSVPHSGADIGNDGMNNNLPDRRRSFNVRNPQGAYPFRKWLSARLTARIAIANV